MVHAIARAEPFKQAALRQKRPFKIINRHSREGGSPNRRRFWVPAFAGMTEE